MDLKISDIDKKIPEFKEVKYENENWEVLKQVQFSASDNIRMKAWAITKSENAPQEEEWQNIEAVTPDIDITTEIIENGTYYIWLQDIAGNTNNQKIQIDKVDNTPPQIAYTINQNTLAQGFVTITVTAEDTQSGLYDSPFSWDKITWSAENSSKTVKENGRYKVYAEDNLGNVGEAEILVDIFPQEGTYELGEGNIITNVKVSADWNGNINNNVQITLNKDLNIAGWQVSTLNYYLPDNFVLTKNGENQINNNNNNNNNLNNSNVENNNSENVSLPNNIVQNVTENTQENQNIMQNETNTQSQNNQLQNNNQNYEPPAEPIVIITTLNVNTTYYLWVKDMNGNITYQTLKIAKAII